MAQNLVINGVTYNGVESLEMANADGEKVIYTEGGGGVELPELSNPGGASDLMAGSQLIDGNGKIVDGTFTIAEELSEQDSLIAQIQTALQGKADGGDIELPELSNPGTAEDLAEGKELIDGDGNVVAGTYVPLDTSDATATADDIVSDKTAYVNGEKVTGTISIAFGGIREEVTPEGLGYMPYVQMTHTVTEPQLVSPEYGGDISLQAPYEAFGDATAEDVAKGKTFTSAAGLLVVGTKAETAAGDASTLDDLLDGSITEINSGVTRVGQYGCYARQSLETVNLPNAQTLATRAFQNCNNITSFSAPSVTSLGSYCFYGNSKLPEVSFPLAKTVPANCFYTCSVLEKADFGVASSIGGYAFYSCPKLAALILRKADAICTLSASTSLTSSGIARGTGYVYVPSALVDSYKEATNWSTYADQIRAIEDYPDICGGAAV